MTGARGRWLGWALLLLAGQAATLALIEAGPRVAYQHYLVPWTMPSRAPAWALAVFGVELVLVALGMRRHAPTLARWLRDLGPLRLLLGGGLFALTSATLSRNITHYAAELVFASVVQLVHLGAVGLLALSLDPAGVARVTETADRLLDPVGGDAPSQDRPDRFVWTLALLVTLTAATLAVVAYQRHPHVPDEVSYLLQARYLATGHLAMPLPAVPEAFNVDLMTYQATRWFSPFPPGWPAILAIGAALGTPWLVNPILGGVAVVLTYLLLGELYPRRTARLATVLLACSPWALFLSMSLMSHVASLVAAVLAAWCVARLRRAPRVGWALLGGASIGIVGLIRPLEGVAVALLLGVWSLGARGRGVLRLWPSAVLTLATIATGALTLPYNRALTGDARTFPVMEYMNATFGPGANDLGFGPNRGSGWEGLDPLPGHGPVDVLINANFNLFQTNTELLGWATGSLLPILLLLLVGRLRRPDAWMLACIAMVIGIHSLYYFSGGPDFGARYWYLILVPCLALAARGIETACERAGAEGGGRVVAGVSALVLTALLVFVPWRAADKYVHYRGMRPDLRTMVTEPAFRDGLILVRGHRHPDYASAVIYGNLDPATPAPIVAWDRTPAQRAELVAAYPTRRFWVIDGPTVTGDGYRVRAGPLTGDELLTRRDEVVADR